jgi:uncharacterized protein (TIGR03437 family)
MLLADESGTPNIADGSVLLDGHYYDQNVIIPAPAATVSLTIGGVPAKIRYAGPGKLEVSGVLKIIAIVPEVDPGPQPLVLTVGDNSNSQQQVTVAVQ